MKNATKEEWKGCWVFLFKDKKRTFLSLGLVQECLGEVALNGIKKSIEGN